jgi:triacylglycerol lipase
MWPAILASQPLTPSCPRLSAPIVLAHGLFGFRRIGLGPLTLTWYFRGIPGILQAAGNRVLVTRVHPTAGVARRARKLGEQILEAFPDEPVHLIGHSMGGLDARELIADPAWEGRVLSLTTIATPHLGSSIADFAKLRVGRIYSLLEKLGIEHRGFLDVTPGAAAEFNRRAPLPDRLPVFSVAGDPPPEEVCWPLRRLHAALDELEGPNDGLVSVASATAFGRPLPSWPVDHLRQMNWLSPEVHTAPCPRVARLYADVVENLANLERDRADLSGRESA